MWEGIYSPRRVSYPCPAAAACPPPPHHSTHSHVPVGNASGSFTVLTAGPLPWLLGAFWLLPLIPGECWQPKVYVRSSECRWTWRGPGCCSGRPPVGGVGLCKEWWGWDLVTTQTLLSQGRLEFHRGLSPPTISPCTLALDQSIQNCIPRCPLCSRSSSWLLR